ncbi:MAG: hypothetical protein QXL15_03485 [Candidatus Korarchaeota archaeon]
MDLLDVITRVDEYTSQVLEDLSKGEYSPQKIQSTVIHIKQKLVDILLKAIESFIGALVEGILERIVTSEEANIMLTYYRSKISSYIAKILEKFNQHMPDNNNQYIETITRAFLVDLKGESFSRKEWFSSDSALSPTQAEYAIKHSFAGLIKVNCCKEEIVRVLEKRRILAEKIGLRFDYVLKSTTNGELEVSFCLHKNVFLRKV